MVISVKADGEVFHVVEAIGIEIRKKNYHSPDDYRWAKDFVKRRHLVEYASKLEPGYIDLDATEARQAKSAIFIEG